MTLYENKVFDPDKPWMMIPDTEENILRDLEQYTLDPTFEMYGDFVNRTPEWLTEELRQTRAGHTMIFGNFLNCNHPFQVCTDDEGLIQRLEAAIDQNKATPEYQAARARMLEKAKHGPHQNRRDER